MSDNRSDNLLRKLESTKNIIPKASKSIRVLAFQEQIDQWPNVTRQCKRASYSSRIDYLHQLQEITFTAQTHHHDTSCEVGHNAIYSISREYATESEKRSGKECRQWGFRSRWRTEQLSLGVRVQAWRSENGSSLSELQGRWASIISLMYRASMYELRWNFKNPIRKKSCALRLTTAEFWRTKNLYVSYEWW